MADENIDINIDVESNAGEEADKMASLKTQIRETRDSMQKLELQGKATGAQYEKLRAKLDNLNDAQDRAKFKAGQFEDRLAALPGPLGKIGSGIKAAGDSFATFGKTLTISLGVIGLLVSAFFAIKEALGKTKEGTEALSKVTSAFNKILAPVLALFEKLGVYLVNNIVPILDTVGSAITKVAKFFGASTAKIDETTKSLEKNNEAANKLKEEEEKRIKEAEESKKKAEEASKKREEDRKKREAEAEKRRQEQLEKSKKADEVEIEAFKATLSEREKEEYEAGIKLAEQRKALADAGRTDMTAIEEQYRIKLAEIKKKYDDEEAKKNEEKAKKDKEDLQKKQEDERGILLTGLQAQFEDLDRKNQQADLDFEQDLQRFAQQREILAEQEAIELQNTELTEFQKTEIRKKYADARMKLTEDEVATEKAAAEAKHQINMAYLGLFEQFGNLLGQLAGKNKGLAIAGIIISQAASIGQIIANTAIANAKSVAASPLTFGAPWVAINTISAGLSIAATIASAAKSIQQINSQPGAPASNAGAGGASSAPQLPAPRVGAVAAPQIQTTGGQNPTAQIAETIGRAQSPVRAYVVSQDISSQQALDRRTNRAATFVGG